jgi:hypothetical protein
MGALMVSGWGAGQAKRLAPLPAAFAPPPPGVGGNGGGSQAGVFRGVWGGGGPARKSRG